MNGRQHLYRLMTMQKHEITLCKVLQQNFHSCNHPKLVHKFIGKEYTLSRTSPLIRHSSNYSNAVTVKQKGAQVKIAKAKAVLTESVDALADLYPLRYVYVQSCANQWIEAPDGVTFDAGYVDSKLGIDKCAASAPVIVGIPSTVGTHLELTTLMKPFVKLGYRVVLLNMPDNKYCIGVNKGHSTMFEQTIEDRSHFIREFLTELNISKVHMLIANSCSVYCAVNVTSSNKDLIQSLVLINPTGTEYTEPMKPVSYHRKFGKMWDNHLLAQQMFSDLVSVFKKFTKKRDWTTDDVITYSRVVRNLNLSGEGGELGSEIILAANGVQTQCVPVLAMYGEDTDNFSKTSMEEYLHMLGVSTGGGRDLQKLEPNETGKPKSCSVFLKGQPAHLASMDLPVVRRTLLNFSKSLKPNL